MVIGNIPMDYCTNIVAKASCSIICCGSGILFTCHLPSPHPFWKRNWKFWDWGGQVSEWVGGAVYICLCKFETFLQTKMKFFLSLPQYARSLAAPIIEALNPSPPNQWGMGWLHLYNSWANLMKVFPSLQPDLIFCLKQHCSLPTKQVESTILLD